MIIVPDGTRRVIAPAGAAWDDFFDAPGVGGGASAQFSNAQNICDLAGAFNNISRGGGWGPDITGDGFEGPISDGPIVGGGLTVGDGIGSTSFSDATNTSVNLLR